MNKRESETSVGTHRIEIEEDGLRKSYDTLFVQGDIVSLVKNCKKNLKVPYGISMQSAARASIIPQVPSKANNYKIFKENNYDNEVIKKDEYISLDNIYCCLQPWCECDIKSGNCKKHKKYLTWYAEFMRTNPDGNAVVCFYSQIAQPLPEVIIRKEKMGKKYNNLNVSEVKEIVEKQRSILKSVPPNTINFIHFISDFTHRFDFVETQASEEERKISTEIHYSPERDILYSKNKNYEVCFHEINKRLEETYIILSKEPKGNKKSIFEIFYDFADRCVDIKKLKT